MSSTFFRGMIYTSLAALAEVIFTGLKSWPTLEGRTQLWVLPLYFFGSIFIFEPLFNLLSHLPFLIKGIVYSSIILSIEYLAAFLLEYFLGIVPWNYETSYLIRSSYIRLEYAPIWATVAILGEIVFFYLASCEK